MWSDCINRQNQSSRQSCLLTGRALAPFRSRSLIFSLSFIWTKGRKSSVAEIEHHMNSAEVFFFFFKESFPRQDDKWLMRNRGAQEPARRGSPREGGCGIQGQPAAVSTLKEGAIDSLLRRAGGIPGTAKGGAAAPLSLPPGVTFAWSHRKNNGEAALLN